VAFVTLWSARRFLHDDAFITFRYVDRLWAGHGLSWTLGRPVEGFTHPLWLALLALAHPLPASLPWIARALALASLAGVFVVWARARLASEFLLAAVAFPGLVLWTLGGLETTTFCLLLLVGFTEASAVLQRGGDGGSSLVLGFAFAAAGLTRPEGVVCGAVALAFLCASGRRREAARALVPFGAPLAAYALFRLVIFSELIPNSARVKVFAIAPAVQFRSALEYLTTGLARFHSFGPEALYVQTPFGIPRFGLAEWAPPALLAAAAILLRPTRARILGLLLAAPIVLLAISGGGDHMRGMRLLVPAVLVALAGAATPAPTHSADGSLRVLAIAVASWNLAFSTAWNAPNDQAASVGAQVGHFLERRAPAGSLVATATGGSTPYFAPSLEFIDTLGLNDRVIARRPISTLHTYWQAAPGHRKGDGGYVLERQPDVIVIGPAQGARADAGLRTWFLTDMELSKSPRFHAEYRPFAVLVPVERSLADSLPLPRAYATLGAIPCVLYLRRGSPAEAAMDLFGAARS